MPCTVCGKRRTEQFEHESKVVLQRMSLREGFQPIEVLDRLDPLCRLCRLVFQQACAAHHSDPAEAGQRLLAIQDHMMQTRARGMC
jgi:hypothetical protein